MWKLEVEEDYFRIFDKNQNIAGYFDPDYGKIFPKENENEIIEKMLKNHDKIAGGFLIVPMVKFGVFHSDFEGSIDELKKQLDLASKRISRWFEYVNGDHYQPHAIRLSHTDHDMLSITLPKKFIHPIRLDKKELLEELKPTLDLLQKQGLL